MSTKIILYPDLSNSETEFIQSQVNLVLNPECIGSSPKDIFPPKSRKFLVPRIEYVQRFYQDFKIPKNENDRYIRNLRSMPKLERTIQALKWAKVDKSDLKAKPDLILMTPNEIANLYQILEWHEGMSMSEFLNLRKHSAVHGLFAKKYIQKTILSLKILGFQSASDNIRKLDFARYTPLLFHKMEYAMANVVLRSMVHQIPSFGELLEENHSMSAVNIARMVHLWKLLDKPELDAKSLKKLDSTEAIIQLNALILAFGMKEIDQVDSKIVWRYLLNSSFNFPLGLQIDYLTKIGFSLEEIQSIFMNETIVRLSSKNLPLTHENYVPLMSEKLSEIKDDYNNELSAVELMNILTSHDFGDISTKNNYKYIETQ